MVAAALLTTGTSLATFSTVPYIRDVVQGKAKPRLVSWLVWTILLGLTAIVSWQAHQLSSAILSGASMVGCLIVTLLAVRYGSLELTRIERYTLFGAVVGLVLWLVFNSPMLVLLATLAVDAMAYLPTYINGWRDPHYESMGSYVAAAAGSGCVLLAAIARHASATGIIYPLYSTTFGALMVAILVVRRYQHVWYRLFAHTAMVVE